MGLLGPIRKKPKATRFCCMPFIRKIWATEMVLPQNPWNMHCKIPRNTFLNSFYPTLGYDLYRRIPVSEVFSSQWDAPREAFFLFCCAELEAETSPCVFSSLFDGLQGAKVPNTGHTSTETCQSPLLEQYANPLLNFIFLIPLIRNGGIKPAGRNPC